MIKVQMIPSYEDIAGQSNGIARVIEAWHKYLPPLGVEFVSKDATSFDIKAVHAGMTANDCDVAHLHGMYFTADYNAPRWEFIANENIAKAVRGAKVITVPSQWVAEIFQRDMHMTPHVVPHGIDAEDWANDIPKEDYVLWNKNRAGQDVCTTEWLSYLAGRFKDVRFVSTYLPREDRPNISKIGVISPEQMKQVVQRTGVYLSTTKETFGIGILEAMASGVPILGFDFGGNQLLVKHKVNGYLAEPNNVEDLAYGLSYCMTNRVKLGRNGVELAKLWTWQKAVESLYAVYAEAMKTEEQSVSVVIPVYNKQDTVKRAIDSVMDQTYPIKEIVIVDDGSSDKSASILDGYYNPKHPIVVIHQNNQGVAHARNNGIMATTSKYVSCLDADDWLEPNFLKVCVSALEADRSLGIAYTRLMTHMKDGSTRESDWPGDFNFDAQLHKSNQIPTCCVYRRTMFDRLGGYRQRYAPVGAGVEDAEFWLRAGAMGFNAKLVTREFLFDYSLGIGITSQGGYYDIDWTSWHPWTRNSKTMPFASLATPTNTSHAVRQYDEPNVSVITPVGKGHEKEIINVLDSLEAQTFTRWESIVVWDSPQPIDDYTKKAFPFVKWMATDHPGSGPGVARNLGAKAARGKFLLFVDADDWLYPEAIETMLIAYQNSEGIIYTDYVGKAIIDQQYAQSLGDRLLQYDAKTGSAVIRHYSALYDCDKAQQQPDIAHRSLFHWCLVTCLIPKRYHEDIGGFDESMRSWEDVDYHWRMARAGKCYVRVPQPLMVYRFTTGNRREAAMDTSNAQSLIQYMDEKYRSIDTMPCPGGCGQRTVDPQLNYQARSIVANVQSPPTVGGASDNDFVMCRYIAPNSGDHNVIGAAVIGDRHLNYGYRSGGDVFLVHKADIALQPHYFQPIEMETPIAAKPVKDVPKADPVVVDKEIPDLTNPADWPVSHMAVKQPEPVVENKEAEFTEVKAGQIVLPEAFLTDFLAKAVRESGFESAQDIVDAGVGGLTSIKGIGVNRAQLIYDAALKAIKE